MHLQTQRAPAWHRLERETDAMWRGFETYLAMGVAKAGAAPGKRSFSGVATQLGHFDHSTSCRWAGENDWIERATAFDHAGLAVLQAAVEDVQKDHLDLARRMVRLARKKLAKLEAKVATELEDETMSASSIVSLLKESIALERLVTGQSTENVSVHATTRLDLSGASSELLEALDAHRRAKALAG